MDEEQPKEERRHFRTGLALSEVQHRLVTTALAGVSLFVILLLLYAVFVGLSAFVGKFANVLTPLAVAGIFALLLRPVVRFVEERSRLNRLGAIILLYFMTLLGLTAFLWFVIPLVLEQTLLLIRNLPGIYEGLRELLEQNSPQLLKFLNEFLGAETLNNLGAQIQSGLAELAKGVLSSVASMGQHYALGMVTLITGVAIVPVYLFFFLRSDSGSLEDLEPQLDWVREDVRQDLFFLAKHFIDSIETFFQGQMLVGLIMGALLALGFSLAGVEFGFALGLLIGLLNIIPYLGTIIGLGTVLPIAYFQPGGGFLLMSIALVIFIVVQVIEGYLLTPRIMGNRTGLHPVVIIIAIFFWGTALGGILGMILAIPLTAFFVVAWRLLREKYLRRWMSEEPSGSYQ